MRFERSAGGVGRVLSDVPIAARQNSEERVVPQRAVRIQSWLGVHAMRVQIGGMRAMRHVDGTVQAARVNERRGNVLKELVEVAEGDRPGRRRSAVAPLRF